jgi:hypothetical protein
MKRILLGVLLLLATGLWSGSAVAQGGPNHAALIIQFGDGSTLKKCVEFTDDSITGEELLQRSNLDVILDYNSGLGGAVCSINNSGCAYPVENCFCQCPGEVCKYWAYYHWQGGKWEYSAAGASNYTVTDGVLEGWSWGAGTFGSGTQPPPVVTFEQICASQNSQPAFAPAPIAPDIVFETAESYLAFGSCAVLTWTTWNADQVTLNGASVSKQDRKEVCPASTQRYVLEAANAKGQTMRELVVSVEGTTPAPTPTAAMQDLPSPQQDDGLPQAKSALVRETALPAKLIVVTAPVATFVPVTPDQAATQGDTLPPTQIVPLSSVVTLVPTRARSLLDLLTPTATPTTESLRELGADGRPTPTPMLLARVQAASGPAGPIQPTKSGGAGRASGLAGNAASPAPKRDRNLSLALLPGYGTFLLMAATLLGVCGWIAHTRRR